MKANKNTSFFKMLASLVGVAGVSALINVPAFALTHLSESTTGTIHSKTVPPRDDTAPGTQPGEPGKPGEPDRPGEPSEPDQPGQPSEPGQPGSEQD